MTGDCNLILLRSSSDEEKVKEKEEQGKEKETSKETEVENRNKNKEEVGEVFSKDNKKKLKIFAEFKFHGLCLDNNFLRQGKLNLDLFY